MLNGPESQHTSSNRLAVGAVVALAAFVAVAVLVATASGLGVTPDSVAYLSLADELRENGSPYAILAPSPTHYAPLWSMLVGGISAFSGVDDLLGIGRFLNALAAAAIPLLVYVAVRRSAAAPAWWPVVAAAVAAVMFGLFRLSVRALTEPLFVALVLVTLLLVEAGGRQRSRRVLLGAAATAAGVVLTRFAGLAILVPIVVAVWPIASSARRRVLDVLTVSVITVAPTALWALAAPSTTTSTHLGTGARAGLEQLVQSFVEAGHVVLDPPSTDFADPLYLLLGAIVLAAPFIGAVAVAARRGSTSGRHGNGGGRPGGREMLDRLRSTGLLPWLLFLAAYTVLIAAQRWSIDREIIDRYWVPSVVVGVVVVARAIAESGLLATRRWRRVVVGVAGIITLVNLGLLVTFATTRADRGIELNETRYRDAALFSEAAGAGVDVVLTDSSRLVEFHLLVLGDTGVDVRDVGCRRSGESNVVAMAEVATSATAVVLAGDCDREDTRTALAAIGGSEVIREPGIGTLVLIERP